MAQKCKECGCVEIWDADCQNCGGSGENEDGEECHECDGSGYFEDHMECSGCGEIDAAFEFETEGD